MTLSAVPTFAAALARLPTTTVSRTQTKPVMSPAPLPARLDLDNFPEREQALLREQLEGFRAYRDSRRLTDIGSTDAIAVILDFLRHAGGVPPISHLAGLATAVYVARR